MAVIAILAATTIVAYSGITYQYTSNNNVTPKTFCITSTLNPTRLYYASSKTGGAQQEGICPGHKQGVTRKFGLEMTLMVHLLRVWIQRGKADWTFVTCSYADSGSYPTIVVTVSNGGTVGQIWIDDLSISIATP